MKYDSSGNERSPLFFRNFLFEMWFHLLYFDGHQQFQRFEIMRFIICVAVFFLSSAVLAQQDTKIAYVYPAGGQIGTTFEVLIGGRQIARSAALLISGSGVHGRIIHGYGSMAITNGDDGEAARQIYEEAKQKLESNEKTSIPQERKEQTVSSNEKDEKKVLPSRESIVNRFPYFSRLANPAPDDLQLVYYEYFAPRIDRKPKETLNQGVLVEITIDSDAEPGDRDLRLLGSNGLSAPVRFVVGTIPEVCEREPNDTKDNPLSSVEMWRRRMVPKTIRQLETLELPIVINGRIRTADVDQFHFKAKAGQKLVIGVRARHLIPYLADAVPGWFQAAMTLYDPNGNKIEDAASFRFDPDPILFFDVPKNGEYTLEIQDSIFRGRDDFVYRISIGELPFVTSVFPLGGRLGETFGADIAGQNLYEKIAVLDTKQSEPSIREKTFLGKNWLPYPIRYAVDDLPEQLEAEPNNNLETAVKVTLPIIINGRISDAADADCFSFEGKKGNRIVLDISARSLNSPLDASIELLDAAGNIVAANDDRADSKGPNIGLETHHADPYLNVELPADGLYTVRLFNALQRGGPEYAYRLRISPPREDFAVYCEPASLTLSNTAKPLKIHIVRKDGFRGGIQLRLAGSGEWTGIQLDETKIPAETDEFTAKLSALPKYDGHPMPIVLEAIATIGGKEKRHTVIAADDWEQAFIYHHLVPAKSLTVAKPNRNRPGVFRPK